MKRINLVLAVLMIALMFGLTGCPSFMDFVTDPFNDLGSNAYDGARDSVEENRQIREDMSILVETLNEMQKQLPQNNIANPVDVRVE